MSKHWRPRSSVTPLRGRKRWTRSDAYWSAPAKRPGISGTTVAVVLAAAACVGLAVGLGSRDAALSGATGVSAIGTTERAVERVTFGLCVWGGGENCVVDGDTIYLHGQKIRIAGIDAPETHDFKCPAEKELGDRATVRLQGLVNSGSVSLISIDRDEDVYGRKLRNVAVDGQDVGDVLVSEGLARHYRGVKMGWC